MEVTIMKKPWEVTEEEAKAIAEKNRERWQKADDEASGPLSPFYPPPLDPGGKVVVPAHVLRELAVAASCDPRTIQKLVRGERVRGLAGLRATALLHERGYLPTDAKQWSGAADVSINTQVVPCPFCGEFGWSFDENGFTTCCASK